MNTIGDYTAAEVAAMDPETFNDAKERGFSKLPTSPLPEGVESPLADPLPRPAAAGLTLGNSVPEAPAQPSPNVWATRKAAKGTDFTCPSGQTCRLHKIEPEALLRLGILDKVTRLEGLASELVERAEGQPPAAATLPSREDLEDLLSTINAFTLAAVAEPRLYADDDTEAPEDGIRVSEIDLEDRMAIMEYAMRGIKSLDRFRHAR